MWRANGSSCQRGVALTGDDDLAPCSDSASETAEEVTNAVAAEREIERDAIEVPRLRMPCGFRQVGRADRNAAGFVCRPANDHAMKIIVDQ